MISRPIKTLQLKPNLHTELNPEFEYQCNKKKINNSTDQIRQEGHSDYNDAHTHH